MGGSAKAEKESREREREGRKMTRVGSGGQRPKWKEVKVDPEGKGAVARRGQPEGERDERKTHRLREDFEDGPGLSSREGKEALAQIVNRHALHSVLTRCGSWISLEKQSKQGNQSHL